MARRSASDYCLNKSVVTRFMPDPERVEVAIVNLSQGNDKCYEHSYPGRWSQTGCQYNAEAINKLPSSFEEAKEFLVASLKEEVEAARLVLEEAQRKLSKAMWIDAPTKNGKQLDLSEANY